MTVAVLAYVASLVLPAVRGEEASVAGITCLFFGWLVPLPWSANLVLLVAGVARAHDRHRFALASALLAVFTGLTAVRAVPHLGVGFVAWIASMVAVVIASALAIVDSDAPTAWARVRARRSELDRAVAEQANPLGVEIEQE